MDTMRPVNMSNTKRLKNGVKYDDGKNRYDLIPKDALDELTKVYTMGAKKYDDRNWEKGMSWGRIFAAIMRHLWAMWGGEDRDKESGLLHVTHAAWGCFSLASYQIRKIGKDTRKC